MRCRVPGALLLALAASTAAAESLPMPPPGGVVVSADGRTVISSTLCAELAAAAPDTAGADYMPGVDANGDAVAPADLPGGAPPLALDNFPIEISVNLQKRFGIPADAKVFRGKAIVGLVTIRDGRAFFNGEPITDNERAMMVAACRETKR